jgi:hypothetical protein
VAGAGLCTLVGRGRDAGGPAAAGAVTFTDLTGPLRADRRGF